MTGITPENVGKHGVLAKGESHLVGTLLDGPRDRIQFQDDQIGPVTVPYSEGLTFTPDAPKARLGMIVKHPQGTDGEILIRFKPGWYEEDWPDGFPTLNTFWTDEQLAEQIANPVFPGVADL